MQGPTTMTCFRPLRVGAAALGGLMLALGFVLAARSEAADTPPPVGQREIKVDLFPLARTLHEMGYRGSLRTMGFTQSGDIPAKLTRGRQAWERIRSEALGPATTGSTQPPSWPFEVCAEHRPGTYCGARAAS